MASVELPYWLMITGALLVGAGFVGLAFNRERVIETETDPVPDEPTAKLAQQMPPLPTLLDSTRKKRA
jgi:hypothetical protein